MFNKILSSPVRAVFFIAALLFPCVLLTAFFVGGTPATAAITSLVFIGVGIAMASQQARLLPVGASVALIGQAIALTAALQGHPWQIDSHMLFFALLACLVCLRSVPAILAATVIVAVHHISLSFLLPSLIYPSGSVAQNASRTVLHAVILILETAALVLTVVQLKRLDQEMQSKADDLEISLKASDDAREQAQTAQRNAEQSKKDAVAAQQQAEDLLAKSREAEIVRQASEAEQARLKAEQTKLEHEKAEEQAKVVDALRLALSRLEEGDLTARIVEDLPGDYKELGDAFNTTLNTLEEMVSEVAQRSAQMDAEVGEISSATSDLANRTERQAATLRETSEALEELTQSLNQTVVNMDEANNSATGAQSSARTSTRIVSEASEAMSAIQTEADEISKIVEMIDGISFQTNLLALNAGVEAARAGEAGRGFAVVASEVRGLAQRSSDSATNIRALIDRSGQEVTVGSQKISETVSALQSVLEAVLEITTKMELISQNTREQNTGISSLNSSVADLDAVTQQNAAMFEETSAACANLSQGARIMRELTQRFHVSSGSKAVREVA